MISVTVTIDAILLYCDESISRINIGNGYSIRRVNIDDIPLRDKITDGNGKLTISYLGSRLSDSAGISSLMCLQKEDVFEIPSPQFGESGRLTDRDLMCQEHLELYKDNEMEFLNNTFSLLRLFKQGNIGVKQVFFEHRFTVMGFFNNTQKQTSDNVTRNIVDTTMFTLTEQEILQCNQLLAYMGQPAFMMLKNIIDEFVWGLEQVDIPTGFEQFTTALEMIFLSTNQQNKKEVLAKRTAVLLGIDNAQILSIYNKMKVFYRYRSESLHEGDGDNISSVELKELEEIVRFVINKYHDVCKNKIQNGNTITWGKIKSDQIAYLINSVTPLIAQGVLPQ